MKSMQKAHGFTLIELMIVVVIIAILSAIAIPSYRDFVVRSKRSDAKVALTELANLQEKWFSEKGNYTDKVEDLGYPTETSDGQYLLRIYDADADGYTIEATTAAGSGQHKDDAPCRVMELTNFGIGTPKTCWED